MERIADRGLVYCIPPVAILLSLTMSAAGQPPSQRSTVPPKGFTALYNGKDLTGWRGGDTFDHRKLLAMSEADRAAQIAKWNQTMRAHWTASGEELVNDGQGAYATTEKDYGDFELLVEYRTVPKADSGIYLRGVPQVQIWDYTEEAKFNLGANKGSGGLWNNSSGAPGKDPLVLADKPFGQWNRLRIVMVGSRVSVWLNDANVVDHAIMENYYDRSKPVPARGPIQLQTHGGEIRWRNIFIREIGSEEANTILRSKGAQGFIDIFNGRNFDGWAGPLENYEVRDGGIVCRPEKGDTAYVGMTELQVLDDNYENVRGAIDPKQAHGSAYGMVAAARGYQHPIGDWNVQDVSVAGSTVRVELNGTVILNADLSKVNPATYLGGREHPGVSRTSGFFGFAGHNDPVMFRNIQIRKR